MHRGLLLSLLGNYESFDKQEQSMVEATMAFIEANSDCFERTLMEGHVTGSAWIVSLDQSQVLLLHHSKLNRWLQPGGHCDGEPDVHAVALREVLEETGLAVSAREGSVFDVDIHTIPARGAEPAHLHYDIRFLFEANPADPILRNEESNAVRWIALSEVAQYTNEESVLRMVRKLS
jgi:8-oxo-dGTP pyrophosphatase MutT (NUDIX family)